MEHKERWLNKSSLAIMVLALITASITAYLVLIPATHTPSPCVQSEATPILCVHVIADGGKPLEGTTVHAGPTNSTKDVFTPDNPGGNFGPTLKQCYCCPDALSWPSGVVVRLDGSVLWPNGTLMFPPCPVKSYKTNTAGWVVVNRTNADYYLLVVYYDIPNQGPLNRPFRSDIITTCANKAMYVTVDVSSGKFNVTCSD